MWTQEVSSDEDGRNPEVPECGEQDGRVLVPGLPAGPEPADVLGPRVQHDPVRGGSEAGRAASAADGIQRDVPDRPDGREEHVAGVCAGGQREDVVRVLD